MKLTTHTLLLSQTTLLYHATVVNGVCGTNYAVTWWRATHHDGQPEKFYRNELSGPLSLSDGELSYLSWESDHALHLRWEVARTQRSGTGNGAESALHHPRSSSSSEAHPNRLASSQLESSSLNTKPDCGYRSYWVSVTQATELNSTTLQAILQLSPNFNSDLNLNLISTWKKGDCDWETEALGMWNPTSWLQTWPLPNICSDSLTLRKCATLSHPGMKMMATVVCNYPWPHWIMTTATDYQAEPDQTQAREKPVETAPGPILHPKSVFGERRERRGEDWRRLYSLFFCPLYCAVFFFCFETFGGASLVAEDKRDMLLFYAAKY